MQVGVKVEHRAAQGHHRQAYVQGMHGMMRGFSRRSHIQRACAQDILTRVWQDSPGYAVVVELFPMVIGSPRRLQVRCKAYGNNGFCAWMEWTLVGHLRAQVSDSLETSLLNEEEIDLLVFSKE